MGIRSFYRKSLTYLYGKQYQNKLKKYKLSYQNWIKRKEKENLYSLEKEQENLEDREELVFLSFHHGKFDNYVKNLVSDFMKNHKEVLICYGDEDVYESHRKQCYDPWLKPDWSPDTFLWKDYLGEAVVVRRYLYEQLTEDEKKDQLAAHRKLAELADGFVKGCKTIRHIDGILYHRETVWRMNESDEKVMSNNFTQITTGELSVVSMVILSKDNLLVVKHLIQTIKQTVHETPYEIILIDNGSCKHVKDELEEYSKKIGLRYFYELSEFNYSRLCNFGASQAKGDILLFLNDDIEAVENGWLRQMTTQVLKPWVGAVGMKLWYPNSDKIQHAGITNIGIGPVHKLQFLKDNKCYYDNRNRGIRNVLAVTGACLMIQKKVFEEIGGFAEEMRVAFNDVDLCYSLYEKGYYNVVINHTHMLHHESLSRGKDDSEEKMKRLYKERDILYSRHKGLINKDPFYHKWLNAEGLDTRIVPAYEEGILIKDNVSLKEATINGNLKRNECLLVRIEYADTKMIQGYAVVLGSSNAIYEKKLILQQKEKNGKLFLIEYCEQYRSDIADNMPDQKNIALCGFHITFKDILPKGEYRIGIMAIDKISKTELINYSNRTIYM